MSKIYIYCPGNVISGGVNSLHNLGASLIKNGFEAGMFYHSAEKETLKNTHILSYKVPAFSNIEDNSCNVLIVSETETLFLSQFSNIKKIVYWLGLNYYFKKPPFRFPFNIKLIRKFIICRNYFGYSSGIIENYKRVLNRWNKANDEIWKGNVLHMSNSYYVAEYCKWRGIDKVFVLHNPVRDEYYIESGHQTVKKNVILFGPKTSKLLIAICRLYFSYKVVRLKHLPAETVKQHMKEAKVFAEFGNNSGRDRMLREAALMGCVVISNTRGSAALYNDMPIPSQYKIPDTFYNYPRILKMLKKCIVHYSFMVAGFDEYVQVLNIEKKNFSTNVKEIFSVIMN